MPVIPGEPMARHLARVAAEAVAGQAPGTCTLPRSLPECGQCQAAARLPADGRPAARAALSFSGPVSQVHHGGTRPGPPAGSHRDRPAPRRPAALTRKTPAALASRVPAHQRH
jgi:hypothetical protein